MSEETEVKKKLKCVEVVNKHPDKLNDEGKRILLTEIADELPIEEVNKLIRNYGYGK